MESFRNLALGLGAMLLATPATAATVYDNGAPVGTNGNDATAWVQAEDFTFAANTSLTGARVFLAGFGDLAAFDGRLQYYIFAGGGTTPGGVLATGDVTTSVTDTGQPWDFGGNIFEVAFDFAGAFDAVAGTDYFFGFHASAPGDFNRDDVYWVNVAANGTLTGVESAGGTFDNWSNNGVEHAFQLVDGAVVPEPAAWAMMIVGVGAVGGALRRRSAVRTAIRFA